MTRKHLVAFSCLVAVTAYVAFGSAASAAPRRTLAEFPYQSNHSMTDNANAHAIVPVDCPAGDSLCDTAVGDAQVVAQILTGEVGMADVEELVLSESCGGGLSMCSPLLLVGTGWIGRARRARRRGAVFAPGA